MKGELQLSFFVVQCILFFPISVGGLLLIAMELYTGKFSIHLTRECFNLPGTQ